MEKVVKLIGLFVFVLVLFSEVSAEVDVEYFHSVGCTHCANVVNSGILKELESNSEVNFKNYEIRFNLEGQNRFRFMENLFGLDYREMGTPFMFFNDSGKYSFIMGDSPIIENAGEYARGNFEPMETFEVFEDGSKDKITFWGIIVAALIDSINPCAFGVLIFLMIALLKVNSSRRALRYGLFYSLVIFLVYFLAGFGIFKAIQAMTSIAIVIYLIAGSLVLGIGILEFIDYFRTKYNKESILKIPTKFKPLLEKTAKKGTLPAVFVLGVLVSLFELPCTGGIYLAILSMMSMHQNFAWGYLFLYNLIFVLPLIIITLIIYKGASPEKLQKWTQSEKGWMKLAAGTVLLLLGAYILKGAL